MFSYDITHTYEEIFIYSKLNSIKFLNTIILELGGVAYWSNAHVPCIRPGVWSQILSKYMRGIWVSLVYKYIYFLKVNIILVFFLKWGSYVYILNF